MVHEKEPLSYFTNQSEKLMLDGIENRDGLYEAVLQVHTADVSLTASNKSKSERSEADLWHRRSGHLSFDLLNRSVPLVNCIRNFPLNQTNKSCHDGLRAKSSRARRKPKKKLEIMVVKPIEIVSTDVIGPTIQ